MKLIKLIVCMAVIVTLPQYGFPQRSTQNKSRVPSKSAPASRNEAAELRRMLTLSRVRGFVDRVLSFRDVEAKVRTLIRVGDSLWKYDESYARQLFLTADDVLKGVTPADKKSEAASEEGKLSADKLLDLRSEVIAHLSRHDAALAQRLINSSADADHGAMNQRAAMNLIEDDPAKAVAFAERGLSNGGASEMIGFLLRLRRQNAAMADELFIKTLGHLAAAPHVDGNDLMTLGVYLFTSPIIDPSLEERGALAMQAIGGEIVVNLSKDRAGVPPTLIRAYLTAAIQILARPVRDPRQQKLYYISGYQLLPKAQRFAPDLAPQLLAAMQAIVPDLPPALQREEAFARLKPRSDYTFDDTLRELDDIADGALRDLRCVMIAQGLYNRGDFTRAGVVAEKVKETATRSQLFNIINYGQAAKALKSGETALAEETAGKLEPGVERAVLWLQIARAHAKQGEPARLSGLLSAALEATRRVDDARRPYLILAVAGESAPVDPAMASQALSEAVKMFNAGEGRRVGWYRTIDAGGRKFHFPLIGFEEHGIAPAIRQLFAADPEGVEAAVLTLKHERILGDALRELAGCLLTQIRA
jgi:hypothetical protein